MASVTNLSFLLDTELAKKVTKPFIKPLIQQPSQQRSGSIQYQVINIGPSWQEELGHFYKQRCKEPGSNRGFAGSTPEQGHTESNRNKHDEDKGNVSNPCSSYSLLSRHNGNNGFGSRETPR